MSAHSRSDKPPTLRNLFDEAIEVKKCDGNYSVVVNSAEKLWKLKAALEVRAEREGKIQEAVGKIDTVLTFCGHIAHNDRVILQEARALLTDAKAGERSE